MISKKTLKFALYILIIFSVIAGSCTRKSKLDRKNLIPEKELISLLMDIHITDGLLSIPKINTTYSSLDSITTYYHVIEQHGYTKEMMDKTMKYYFMSDPKTLNKIYEEVLVRLSDMESRVEKQSYIEQARISNLWTGKEFYAIPSLKNEDSTRFDLTYTNAGYYRLAFSATVYPDDQSVNPGLTVYSTSPDSLETGKRKYFKPLKYLKDGKPHMYILTLKVPANSKIHFGGSLFDSDCTPSGILKHYKIDGISIAFSVVEV